MPILSSVGRRSPGQVGARTIFYSLLCVGAVACVYPLLLVFGQAMSDGFDLRDNAIVPRYLYDDNELALKHLFSYTRTLPWLASRHHRNAWTTQPNMREDRAFLSDLRRTIGDQGFSLSKREAVLRDYNDFKQTLRTDEALIVPFRAQDLYRPFLKDLYGKRAAALQTELARGAETPNWLAQAFPDASARRRVVRDRGQLAVAVMNHELQSDYSSMYSVELMSEGNLTVPTWRPGTEAKDAMWSRFHAGVPGDRKWVVNSDAFWHDFLKARYDKIAALNAKWGMAYSGFSEIRLSFDPPSSEAVREDWKRFVVERWPRRLLRLPTAYSPQWRDFLRRRLAARVGASPEAVETLNAFNEIGGSSCRTWDEVFLPETWPSEPRALARLWVEFSSSGAVPAEAMILDGVERRFTAFLHGRYVSGTDESAGLAELNARWGTAFESFDRIASPAALADYDAVFSSPTRLRLSHAFESFGRVTEYMAGRGRAAQNTIILVIVSLLSALTINPIAAYSLSRFTMRQSHKILIFFLATMAFPAEVAMIPNFLLLRDLHLLNTYSALILPGMANGFSIFLLKCFFDSLPKELYEAAEMDGASELQCFRMVALPLVLPIMAYVGLGTFVAAYGSFMWAFVICPEQDMWTLMVWVYDFQSRNPGANYVMASVLLISIPPLIVFLFANKIIMRGIMIPQMK